MNYFGLAPLTRDLQTSRRSFLIGATALGSSLVVNFLCGSRCRAGRRQAGRKPVRRLRADSRQMTLRPSIRRKWIWARHLSRDRHARSGRARCGLDEGVGRRGIRKHGAVRQRSLWRKDSDDGRVERYGFVLGALTVGTSATARAMLIAAAAERWNVPIGEIKAQHGTVSHASGRSATYGALAASAASGPIPMDVALKEPSEWKYIGNETLPRYNSAPKSNGRQQYTIDLREPGMLTAVMIHPPLFGATLRSFDASKAKAMKGIVDVVSTPRGVAVVGTGMWEVMQAREVVTVEWEDDKAEKRSSRDIAAEYRAAADKGGEAVAANIGDVDAAFAKAARVIEARYEFPYLAHAPLEPINAAVRMNADGTLEVWGGHQMPDVYQAVAAKVAGITPDKVILRVMKTGGGFGRRASVDSDIIVEAVATAKAMGWKAPVKVQWTRADDMRAGRYRPAFTHKMRAALDDNGNLVALRDTLVGQSIAKDSFMEKGLVKNGVDVLSVEGMANQPYAIPNLRVDLTTTTSPVSVLWWRSVGSTHTAYALETFIDEIAHAVGKDPVEFRLAMLKDKPRHAVVLRLATEKAGWSAPTPAGRFRGVALAE